MKAIIGETIDDSSGKQIYIFRKHRYDGLKYESLSTCTVDAACDECLKELRNLISSIAGYRFKVVPKDRGWIIRKKKVQRRIAQRQIANSDRIYGLVYLFVEIINPEFIEVAKNDIAGPIRHRMNPVIKGLLIMVEEILAALFHLKKKPGLPH